MGSKPLKAALARTAEHVPRQVLLATGRFIGEGFDNARLDTLFLTMPVSWRGTIAQYVGRLNRLHEHKQHVRVYDYGDLDVPMLVRMSDKRCGSYRRDRRKDALLQQHGYLVLRFLAEDLGTGLDAVLDEVSRALARRMPRS